MARQSVHARDAKSYESLKLMVLGGATAVALIPRLVMSSGGLFADWPISVVITVVAAHS